MCRHYLCLSALVLCILPAKADLINDPVGDTFGIGPVQIDIVSYSAVANDVSTLFTVHFADPISPADAGAANSVAGFVEIDFDNNPLTGDTPLINVLSPGPPILLGVDYRVDLGSEMFHPGSVDFDEAVTSTLIADVPISYGPSTLSFSVPVSSVFNYGIVVGTLSEPTDRAPNGEIPSQSDLMPTPEPNFTVLLGAALALVAVLRRWYEYR